MYKSGTISKCAVRSQDEHSFHYIHIFNAKIDFYNTKTKLRTHS